MIGYDTNDMINTLTQAGSTQTWTLDPAERDYTSTQSGSSTANHQPLQRRHQRLTQLVKHHQCQRRHSHLH
jgi:hypothetical protein